MASFKYDAKIDNKEFLDAITKEIKQIVSNKLSQVVESFRPDFVNFIENHLRKDDNDTYNSLSLGILKKDFGFKLGENVGESVVKEISKTIHFKKLPATSLTVGGLRCEVLKEGIGFLLNKNFSAYDSNGNLIDWLNWLLTAGDTIVVSDYQVFYGDYSNPPSRSRGAVMVKTPSRGFRVDPNHAGTIEDNWITRAFDKAGREIEPILQRALVNAL
jgi:hypothetical protein